MSNEGSATVQLKTMRTGYFIFFIHLLVSCVPFEVHTTWKSDGGGTDRKLTSVEFVESLPHDIRSLLESKILELEFDETNRDTLITTTSEVLFQNGYFFSTVEMEDDDEVFVLRVAPGERSVIRDIVILPDNVPLRASVHRLANELIDHHFSQSEVELWITSVLSLYSDDGRPFTNVTVDSLHITGDVSPPGVIIYVTISNYDEIIIHTIRLEGNDETRESTIFRQARFFPGDRFSKQRIDNIRPRLMRTGLFRSVAEPELRIDSRGGILLLQVQEARFNSFDGLVGYVPTHGGDGYFTGLAHITMRNLFGTMRRFEFRWQRETEFTQELFFKYREPFVAGLPANAAVSFRQRQQDTSYVQTRTRLVADTDVLRQFTLGLSYEYELVIPSADIQVRRVNESLSNLFGIEVQIDTRDELHAPQSGMYYGTEYQTGHVRRSSSDGRLTETVHRITIDAEIYLSPVRRHVLKFGMHGREVRMPDFQESDLFRFGGTRSMRGYSEGQFLGSRVAWTNVEYRYMTGGRSYVFAFFDTGYFYQPSLGANQEGRDSFEYGYGAGLQVETGIGLISVGLGFGRNDTFSTGKIHIGVINEF